MPTERKKILAPSQSANQRGKRTNVKNKAGHGGFRKKREVKKEKEPGQKKPLTETATGARRFRADVGARGAGGGGGGGGKKDQTAGSVGKISNESGVPTPA